MGKPASPTLLALTSAALALPGIAPAANPASQARADYRYSAYREDDISGRATGGLASERYEIDSHQFHVLQPFGEQYDANLSLTHETMSGASPWFITPGTNGPIQIMSGATIQDRRNDLLAKVSRYEEDRRFGVALGYSDEDDYRALNVALDADWEEDAQRTWSGGIGYSDDKLEPTDGGSARFPNRIKSADKDSLTLFGGLTQVFDAETTLQASLNYARHSGFLSDPYKLAFVAGNTLNDSRPEERNSWAFLARLRRWFSRPGAALHVDYRYFDDDWEIIAHTAEVSWWQRLPNDWLIVPAVRYYSQSQAFFYQPFYNQTRPDGFYSSDYRLSPYGAVSFRLEATKAVRDWTLGIGYESYGSDADYALENVNQENPGLVNFDILSLRISRRF